MYIAFPPPRLRSTDYRVTVYRVEGSIPHYFKFTLKASLYRLTVTLWPDMHTVGRPRVSTMQLVVVQKMWLSQSGMCLTWPTHCIQSDTEIRAHRHGWEQWSWYSRLYILVVVAALTHSHCCRWYCVSAQKSYLSSTGRPICSSTIWRDSDSCWEVSACRDQQISVSVYTVGAGASESKKVCMNVVYTLVIKISWRFLCAQYRMLATCPCRAVTCVLDQE